MKNNYMGDYIGTLLQSRTQTHIYHLQTTSFAKHVALQEYYEGIVDLIDGIAEAYQGEYGIIMNIQSASTVNMVNDDDITNYFDKLKKFCYLIREKLPDDEFLVHLYDEVDTLITTTSYKLNFLN